MSIEEQQELKQKSYAEALRYMNNAKETLRKAKKEDKFYTNRRLVRIACERAYKGVLLALDAYLTLNDVELPTKKCRSIDFYTMWKIEEIDDMLPKYWVTVHSILCLGGHSGHSLDSVVLHAAFANAYEIINKIKPAGCD
ncbi:MAG: DUF5618 family protein [Prevotellaceae bacterium]|jgi:hypothetical protein|nr:DUF5618 family protein [Prevotellaceae bacterium]